MIRLINIQYNLFNKVKKNVEKVKKHQPKKFVFKEKKRKAAGGIRTHDLWISVYCYCYSFV